MARPAEVGLLITADGLAFAVSPRSLALLDPGFNSSGGSTPSWRMSTAGIMFFIRRSKSAILGKLTQPVDLLQLFR